VKITAFDYSKLVATFNGALTKDEQKQQNLNPTQKLESTSSGNRIETFLLYPT